MTNLPPSHTTSRDTTLQLACALRMTYDEDRFQYPKA